MHNCASHFHPANNSKASVFDLKVLSMILGSRGVVFKQWKKFKICCFIHSFSYQILWFFHPQQSLQSLWHRIILSVFHRSGALSITPVRSDCRYCSAEIRRGNLYGALRSAFLSSNVNKFAGVFRIHDARRKSAAGTEPDASNRAEGNRSNGEHHTTKVHDDRTSAEAEHV